MIKNYFNGIEGIANYPMLLLIIFFVFFSTMIVYLWKSGPEAWSQIGRLPLEEDSQSNSQSQTSNSISL